MKETWKDIKGYEGKYQVSNLGRVKSLYRTNYDINSSSYRMIKQEKILKLNCDNRYVYVELFKDGERKNPKVHRLVLETFNPTNNKDLEINHIDGNKLNNRLENLEWVTHSENMVHSYKIGLHKKKIGSQHIKSKKVLQYDLQGNLIKEWESTNIAKQNLHISHIVSCCNGKRKTAGKYIWKYKDIV